MPIIPNSFVSLERKVWTEDPFSSVDTWPDHRGQIVYGHSSSHRTQLKSKTREGAEDVFSWLSSWNP